MEQRNPLIGRRGLLAGTAATFAAGAVAACTTTAKPVSASTPETAGTSSTSGIDVIVIGAGVAGLAAARDLTDGGKKVVVVEARNRLGGRLFTDHTSMSVPIDYGPQYIHGEHASTWDLVRKLGLKTHQAILVATREKPGGPWVMSERQDSGFWGQPPGPVDPALKNYRVLGGYDQILAPLADKLSIQLNTVVRRVEYSSTGVTVKAEQQGRQVTYQARAVVVAIPVAVLAADTIEFSPPLPAKKLEEFKAVPQDTAMKVMVEFDHPVVPGDVDTVQDAAVPWYLINGSKGEPGFKGQIVVVGADDEEGARLLALPRERRHAEILEAIRTVVGDPKLQAVKMLEHEWAKDPFARSALSLDDFPDGDLIYEPTGDSVFWAGVITEQVDTSRDSGSETASDVLEYLATR